MCPVSVLGWQEEDWRGGFCSDESAEFLVMGIPSILLKIKRNKLLEINIIYIPVIHTCSGAKNCENYYYCTSPKTILYIFAW